VAFQGVFRASNNWPVDLNYLAAWFGSQEYMSIHYGLQRNIQV